MSDNIQYSVITNTNREIRARWTGTCIELCVFGANWSDCQVEWHFSVEAAAQRFQHLVALYTRAPRTPRRIDFVAPTKSDYDITPKPHETTVAEFMAVHGESSFGKFYRQIMIDTMTDYQEDNDIDEGWVI